MARFYPAGQSANAEFAFHSWLTLYMQAYGSAEPILMREGLMEEVPTATKAYHVPVPPLSLGDAIEKEDGNDWEASFMQSSEVTGTTVKQGPKGLQFTEDDLREDKLPIANANVTAWGRAVRLFSDKKGAAALEAGLTATGFDNQTIFATTHAKDPVKGASTNVNKYDLGLTPSNLNKVCGGFYTLQAENKDPIFQSDDLQFSLVVPTQLKPVAEEALDRQYITDSVGTVSNIAYKKAKLVVLPQLTDASRWYVAINNLARKPILRVVFRPMQMFKLGPESDLWKSKQLMKMYANEKTQHQLVDWRLIATSKG